MLNVYHAVDNEDNAKIVIELSTDRTLALLIQHLEQSTNETYNNSEAEDLLYQLDKLYCRINGLTVKPY